MSYQTGVASSQGDLLDQLNTFLVGNGWTNDSIDIPNRRIAVHKGTVFVSFHGDAVVTTGSIAVFHALSVAGGAYGAAGSDDSGNGQVSADPITTGRRVHHIGNGPYTAYHFFLDGSYCHVALEYASGLYRHFGFGILDKVGTWTGGEYCFGHYWDLTATGLSGSQHSILFDSVCTDNTVVATVHIEGLPSGFQTTEKWGVIGNFASGGVGGAAVGNDRGGTGRLPCIGGVRDGFYQSALGHILANPNNGYVPMFPLQAWRARRSTTPQQWLYLGTAPDLRQVNINYINPGEEFTLGADTWKCFPWNKKSTTLDAGETGNMGVCYKLIP